MPFVLSHESLKSFEKDRLILIESFLTPSTFETLKKSLLNALSLGTKRDLFRKDESIKKALLKKSTQKVVCEMCNEAKLFFAFDQLFDAPQNASSLQEIASVYPLKLGGLLCWQGESEKAPFPSKPNDLILFDPALILPFDELPKGQRFLLFAFAPPDAVYRENEKDPYTHSLKRLDYQTNQPLSQKTHPLIKG